MPESFRYFSVSGSTEMNHGKPCNVQQAAFIKSFIVKNQIVCFFTALAIVFGFLELAKAAL